MSTGSTHHLISEYMYDIQQKTGETCGASIQHGDSLYFILLESSYLNEEVTITGIYHRMVSPYLTCIRLGWSP